MIKEIAQFAIIGGAMAAQSAIGKKIVNANMEGKLTRKQATACIYASAAVNTIAMVAGILAVGSIGTPSGSINTTASDIPGFEDLSA